MPWGHSAFKVKGKTFVFLGSDESGLGISVKLKGSHAKALKLPFTEPTHYGLGKHGWVSANFGPKENIPFELLKGWIAESFQCICPKSVLKKAERTTIKENAHV
jgi:predicted DNA-binding protein (MmcQ/YjbR family)